MLVWLTADDVDDLRAGEAVQTLTSEDEEIELRPDHLSADELARLADGVTVHTHLGEEPLELRLLRVGG